MQPGTGSRSTGGSTRTEPSCCGQLTLPTITPTERNMPWVYTNSRFGNGRAQRRRTDGYARNYRARRNDRIEDDYLPEDETPDFDDFDDGADDRGGGSRARTGGNRDLFGEELYDRYGERVTFVIA